MEKRKNSGCNRKRKSSRCLKMVRKAKEGINSNNVCPGYLQQMCVSRRSFGADMPLSATFVKKNISIDENSMPVALPT
ncbi:hypothetical protein KKG48_01525, partial [Patescibacteria group bacterium]|nr:hypothetical protein [Patescibacteria group bacterium]